MVITFSKVTFKMISPIINLIFKSNQKKTSIFGAGNVFNSISSFKKIRVYAVYFSWIIIDLLTSIDGHFLLLFCKSLLYVFCKGHTLKKKIMTLTWPCYQKKMVKIYLIIYITCMFYSVKFSLISEYNKCKKTFFLIWLLSIVL